MDRCLSPTETRESARARAIARFCAAAARRSDGDAEGEAAGAEAPAPDPAIRPSPPAQMQARAVACMVLAPNRRRNFGKIWRREKPLAAIARAGLFIFGVTRPGASALGAAHLAQDALEERQQGRRPSAQHDRSARKIVSVRVLRCRDRSLAWPRDVAELSLLPPGGGSPAARRLFEGIARAGTRPQQNDEPSPSRDGD
jgi:hypothetical protein